MPAGPSFGTGRDPTLSDQQKEQAIDQTDQALENRRREEDQLEAEAGSLVRHGDYILERIMESRDRHRWLSADDILIYVRDRVLKAFPGSVIETSPAGSDTYRIELSQKGASEFQTSSCAKTRPSCNRPQISSLDALGICSESRVFCAAGLASDPLAAGGSDRSPPGGCARLAQIGCGASYGQ